jgi:hypothetical protein
MILAEWADAGRAIDGGEILDDSVVQKHPHDQKRKELKMKFKTLMIIKAAVALALGIPILLVPEFVYSIFGATLAPGGVFAAREYAASMMGILMVTWFARNAAASDARWAITLGLCLYDAVGFVITMIALISGALNSLGWLVAFIYLFFTAGFGYFLVYSPRPATQVSAH